MLYQDYKNINFEKIKLSSIKKMNKCDGYLSFISYFNKYLNIKIPKMLSLNCVNESDGTYELSLKLSNNDIEKFLTELDLYIKNYIKNDEKLKKFVENKTYYPIVKNNDNCNENHIKVKFKLKNLKLFNMIKQEIIITEDNIENILPKFCMLKGLIQISYLWIMDDKYGVTLHLLQGIPYYLKELELIEN
jgi:hypothetical protein